MDRGGLDPFGDDRHLQPVRQRDDGLGDRAVLGLGQHVLDERAVDLQLAHRQAAQVAQAGVAGAEVVDRELHAERLQRMQLAQARIGARHQRRLGQFEFEQRCRHAVPLERGAQRRQQSGVEQLHRRQVDRHHADLDAARAPVGELAAGLVDDPLADRHDQPRLLGQRDEDGRCNLAELGRVPAQQRLDGGECAVDRIDLRLEHQPKLVARDRVAQQQLDLQLLLRAVVQVAGEEIDAVAPARLGLVHRGVGMAHQLVHVGRVVGEHRDADAARDVQLQRLDQARRAQRGQQPLRDLQRLAAAGHAVQQHHEFVAAEAADDIGVADRLAQALRHELEQRVAGLVAERVVDGLEAVEVDEQHRDRLAGAGRLQHRLAQPLLRDAAVRQAGQQVVVGEVADLLFRGLAVADVQAAEDVVPDRAGGIAHRGQHRPGGERAAATLVHQHLAAPPAAALGGRPGLARLRHRQLADLHEAELLVQHLARVERAGLADRAVGREHAAVRVEQHDAFGRGLEHLGPEFEPLLQRLQAVDRRERGDDRVLALVVEPARRQHGPGGVRAVLPADLELVHHALVGELLEEAAPQLGGDAGGPGIGGGVAEPLARLRVGVQHPVVGHRGHHQGHRHQLEQALLRLGGARARRHLLLDLALVVELRQHLVEAQHQPADLVAAGPVRAQRVIAGAAHRVDHLGQPAQRPRDALRDVVDREQDQAQQPGGRAQVDPHADEKVVHAHLDQARQLRVAAPPGAVERVQHAAFGGVDLPVFDGGAGGDLPHRGAEVVDRRRQLGLRGRQPLAQQRRRCGHRLRVVGMDRAARGAQLALEHEQPGAFGLLDRGAADDGVQPRRDLRDGVEQRRVAQQDQRHRVVAVQVRVEDQVGLVAHPRHQFSPLFQRRLLPLLACGAARWGGAVQRLQREREAAVQVGTAHAAAMQLLGAGELLDRGAADLGGRCGARQRHQRRAQRLDVGGAGELLAGEVDRDVFLVDQDAADEDHRAQVEQVDQQQLLADAQVRQPARQRCAEPRDEPARGGQGGGVRNHRWTAP